MNVLSISHVRPYKKNIFKNLGHAWFPIHFSARGGGFGQGGEEYAMKTYIVTLKTM